ncbi:MAG: FAD-binding oxidoreductase [Sulfolobales archaeon]|nr:FAD-binding oxidoreductase [Sulfolobales archaeon]MDW8082567.1 FAD-binding oxidoreductase [Sulfolobales archaeon]
MRTLVVGAGISGLFIAYELVQHGLRDVTVVDASYPGSGATLRNLGCFRTSFTSPEHVVLLKESIRRWLQLKDRLDFEITQKGYLWVARRPETLEGFKKLVEFHHQFGVPTRILSLDEVKEVEPRLNTKIVAGAMFDPTAGKMPIIENFVKLYIEVKKLGVKVVPYTKVTKLVSRGSKIAAAETSRGTIEADVFVVAAAGDSRDIIATAGVDVPIVDIPRHPYVTEPYAKTINPALIIDWDTPGSPHMTQTKLGSFILARDLEDVPRAPLHSERVDAIPHILKPLKELLPFLSRVNIVRYWMGYYDMTPDHHPIYGPVAPYENLYIAAGFSGHGMMMAPVTGKLIASWILDGKPYIDIASNLTLERFRVGRLVKELAVIG